MGRRSRVSAHDGVFIATRDRVCDIDGRISRLFNLADRNGVSLPITTKGARFKRELPVFAIPLSFMASLAIAFPRPGAKRAPVFLGAFGLFLSPLLALSQDADDPAVPVPPPTLDLEQFPGAIVDKVVVPVPAEIFAVLDKIDEPDWGEQIRLPADYRPEVDRLRLALKFGATVGEGFIAVQAEESQPIKEVGSRVLRLADALALHDAVFPHCQSILENADKEDWGLVRKELDQTQQTVRNTMDDLSDEDLSTLVSLGGWLRGTQALTDLISQSYSLDKAELLNQLDLVSHFFDSVGSMDDRVREHPDIQEVQIGLGEILQALSEGEGDESTDPTGGIVSAGTVKRIGGVCERLLLRFYLDPEPEPNPDDN